MRRMYFAAGAMIPGLVVLMLATAPINAQRGGHGGGGHGGGGGHAAGRSPARVGSVHYAGRAAPVRGAPAVREGAVRAEHYAGSEHRGAYRNPYRDDYFRHFRPGYRSFLIGDASYYYYDDLPPGYQTVVTDGITYYLFDGVYYQAYLYGGQTVYMVVPTQ